MIPVYLIHQLSSKEWVVGYHNQLQLYIEWIPVEYCKTLTSAMRVAKELNATLPPIFIKGGDA